MSITSDIGIMQGRLSPRIDGKIQAFPLENWKNEFNSAKELGFTSIEWIVENPLNTNPLLSDVEINQIKEIIEETNVKIEYICADIFMQVPIFNQLEKLDESANLIIKLIKSGSKVGAKCIEIPFVDNSSIRNKNFNYLIDFFNSFEKILEDYNFKISLETDLEPIVFQKFLNELHFRIGANYDIGNSASLGYDCETELNSYGNRILNLHIKDRKLGGTTVPFGTGNADIEKVLSHLSEINYGNGIIIQGARGEDDFITAKSQLEYSKKIINKLNNV
jgi:hexulose-6-phosphate isomerase